MHLAIFGRDDRAVTTYFPTASATSPLSAESAVPLEFGMELDDRPGGEEIDGLFCPEPFAVEPVRRQLERGGEPDVSSACALSTLLIHKVAPP